MTQYLYLHVPGHPFPQGSKRHIGNGRMIEASAGLKKWRATITAHAIAETIRAERNGGRWPATGPCTLIVTFHFPRPKHHYRTGKYAHLLRDVAPREMQVGPDLDKLVRAVGDAMTQGGVVVDDKQISVIRAAKKWTTEPPYTTIQFEGTHQ